MDRILLGLKECGFDEFARVGNVRKISKPILQHVLHYSERASSQEEADKVALTELRQMLREGTKSPLEAKHLNDAIAELTQQRASNRAEHLKSMRVVGMLNAFSIVIRLNRLLCAGATCAASQLPVLEGSRFAIVILDESSQVVEPMSMIPIAQFRAERALLVGDPLQLPPTLRTKAPTSFTSSTPQPPPSPLNSDDLTKTLFVRLHRAGLRSIMLRKQYRCHPVMSLLASRLFYDGRLQAGLLLFFAHVVFLSSLSLFIGCNWARVARAVDEVPPSSLFHRHVEKHAARHWSWKIS